MGAGETDTADAIGGTVDHRVELAVAGCYGDSEVAEGGGAPIYSYGRVGEAGDGGVETVDLEGEEGEEDGGCEEDEGVAEGGGVGIGGWGSVWAFR